MKHSLWWYFLLKSPKALVAQQVGSHLLQESHPALTIQTCESHGPCSDKRLSITLDADQRPLQVLSGIESCMSEDNKAWNPTYCADGKQCAEQCSLGGVKYKAVHGITTDGHALKLRLFTHGKLTESRVYLLANQKHYHSFYLKNHQFSFDIDPSHLPCGVQAALYFTSMQADGGLSSTNKAGAMYGTGYCDAQCPTALRFINGQANIEPSGEPGKPASKSMGACCSELDLWEGNGLAQAYGAHPCVFPGMTACEGAGCTAKAGLCDHSGCGFASQSLAGNGFYGPNKTLDSQHPLTVVTQFHTSTGTAAGELSEIRQFYVQHGALIGHPTIVRPGQADVLASITDEACGGSAAASAFHRAGGLEALGRAMDRGMVLVMGLSTAERIPTRAAIHKRPATRTYPQLCPNHSRSLPFIHKHHPQAAVTFSNIRLAPIGFPLPGLAPSPHRPPPPTNTPSFEPPCKANPMYSPAGPDPPSICITSAARPDTSGSYAPLRELSLVQYVHTTAPIDTHSPLQAVQNRPPFPAVPVWASSPHRASLKRCSLGCGSYHKKPNLQENQS